MTNHYIKNCRKYKVIRDNFHKNPKNNFNIRYKQNIIIKKVNKIPNNITDESSIECVSDNNSKHTINILPTTPKIVKKSKVKNTNKNGNNKKFFRIPKKFPETSLNVAEDPNFIVPKLKSCIKTNKIVNSRKKKVSFNRINHCVKFGSFWEPVKLSDTSVEKKVFIKFAKTIREIDYFIDTSELQNQEIKIDVLKNLTKQDQQDALILQNSFVNKDDIRLENLQLEETMNNTIVNKFDTNINNITKGSNYTISSVNYNYLLINPNKPVKPIIPVKPTNSSETISVNFSNLIKNELLGKFNVNNSIVNDKNNLISKNSKTNLKFLENIFNNLNFEIDNYCESSLMYNYKLLFLNNNNLIKLKNFNSQLNHFVISSFPNFKINFNQIKLTNNLNKIYKIVQSSIYNNFNNMDNFNHNFKIFNLFNKNNLIYLYIAINFFNTCVFNINNFNEMFLNIFKLNNFNKVQVRLNTIVEGTGANCTNHTCNAYEFGDPTKDCESMEEKILNTLTKRQQELAINGIPRQNYWIMANKDKHSVRSINRPDILTFFISINDKPCKCLIDSGAQMSSMTKAGLKYFDIPSKELPPGKYNSSGMGGITPITHVAQANVVCHDLKFPLHSFKIINNSNPDYYVTLGSDWLKENKIIIDPFNLSIGCQIDKESYWELFCNCKLKICRRILRNIPVFCHEGITPKVQQETLSNFNIALPNVQIVEQKNCLCNAPTMEKLNSFIYFNSNYNDLENNEINDYIVNINENNGKIIDNILIKDTMTNIHNCHFSVIKNAYASYCKLNRGTRIGTVSTPMCQVNDKDYPVRLNNNLNEHDVILKHENAINHNTNNNAHINFTTYNDSNSEKFLEVNKLQNLKNIYNFKHSENIHVHYDLMAPNIGEHVKADDPDLPDQSTWTQESLNNKLKIESDSVEHVDTLQNLLFKYKDVFSQTDFSKEASLDPLTVELTDQIPIFIPQYKFQPDIEDAVQSKVNELIEQRQVVPSKSRYNFPILPIKKRTGLNTADNIRIVLDLRLLNKKAIKFDYPIPDISIILQKLGGFNLYTSLDFTNSFWQLPLDEASQDYMSFSTARGKYKLTRAPQGFVNTAAAFQSSMNYVFGDLLFNKELPVKTIVNGVPVWTKVSRTRLISYIDDVIILSENSQVMELMLELVLKKISEYQLKLKISKCIFSATKLDFVGHEISSNGIRKQPKYVEKVMQVQRPEKIKDLLKFMGMANWVMKFCKNFSEIARPLSILQKTDKKSMKLPIEWTDERIKSFEAIKALIKEDITLAYPMPDKECGELQLFCDASDNSIGSTLCQYQPVKNKDGKDELVLRTIANYSCVLNKHARNYSIREKELSAIRLSLEHYKPYLMGRSFCIWSDHRSLIYLQTMKLINTRLYRTAEELACFDFKICYIPGKDNFYADIMSRIKYDQMIEKATKNHADKIPDHMSVIEISGGGDSLISSLSLILFEWKRKEGKINNYETFSNEYNLKLREKLQRHIYNSPSRYGVTLTKDNRKEWQSYALEGVTLPDEFIQCFANLYRGEIELYFSNTSPVIFRCDDSKKIDHNRVGRLQIKGGTHFNVLKYTKANVHYSKDHIMFHKKINNIKDNSEYEKIEPLPKNKDNVISIKHSNLEIITDKLNRRFTNNFNLIHDSFPLQAYQSQDFVKHSTYNNVSKPSFEIPPNLLKCNHKNNNHSMAYSMFELGYEINYCALFDTCASINLMSETLANYLFSMRLLHWDETKSMNIVCSGGKEIKINMKFAYAEPFIGYAWSFQNVKFGIVRDNIIPCCCIFGFEFMSKNHITLNYNLMTVDMTGEHLANLGIYTKNSNDVFQPNYNNCEYIFKDEIRNFDKNIEKLPIEIISTYKKLFTKDLLNLKIKQLLKNYDYKKAPPHIKKLIDEAGKVATEHCATIESSELICTKPIVNFQNSLTLPEIVKNKFILENFQQNYRDTNEYKTMSPKLQLYCDLSHEKIVKLYNEYLSKLQSDPSVTKASLNIPEEIDHVRIHPMLNFDLISKINFIDNPKSNHLLIKSNKSKNIINNTAFVKNSNKYKIVPDYIKLKNKPDFYNSEPFIENSSMDNSTLEIIRISTLNKSINTAIQRKTLLNDLIRNTNISYKERNALLQEKFNLNNLKFDNEIYTYFKNDEAIINLQDADKLIKDLKHAIQYNKHGKWNNLRMFHTAKKNLFVINDLLIWYRPNDNKILPCVTRNYITNLIIKIHSNNHEGIPKIQNRVKKFFYYPNIEFLTSEIISCCPICQFIKPNIGPNKPRLPNLEVKADYALDHCMGDLTFLQKSNGNVGLFVVIDIASRKCFAEPIKNKTSSEVIRAFQQIIDKQMSGSKIKMLRVDNGTEFTSKEFKEYCKSIGTQLTFGNAFSSKSGGLVERLNGTIKQLIKVHMVKDKPDKWSNHIYKVINNYNHSPHSAINNNSPYEMFIKLSCNLSNPLPLSSKDRDELLKSQPKFPYFKVGDRVLKKIDRIGRQVQDSLKPYFDGPYEIIEEAEHRKSFTLRAIDGSTRRCHYDKLKKFKYPPDWLYRNVYFQKYLWSKFPKNIKEIKNIKNEQYYYKYDNDYTETDNSIVSSPPQKYHKEYFHSPLIQPIKKEKKIFSNPKKQLREERLNMSWHTSDENGYSSDDGEIKYLTPLKNKLIQVPIIPVIKSPANITPINNHYIVTNQILTSPTLSPTTSFNTLLQNCSPVLPLPLPKKTNKLEVKILPNLSNNNISCLLTHQELDSLDPSINMKIRSNIVKEFLTITENEEYNLNQSFYSDPGESIKTYIKPIFPIVSETNDNLISRKQPAVRRKTKVLKSQAPSVHPMNTRRKSLL
ncbi:unnamed protein product [Rotaria socialis]|uniref:RNA-directed DNA polymerase n=1 Tax=Rotaria socialis TaxID=392032 RepID=A0A818SCM8_9BILA|nr:unnamed protein product [Rotaria socialis]